MRKQNQGITLIALVITIVVLLILAGVTITTLAGDNGLLQKATNAKQASKEAEMRERIILAINAAEIKNKGELKKEVFEEELTNEFGEGNFELLVVGEGYLIVVNDIEYVVDKDGKIGDGTKVEASTIENAGDLSKDGQYNGETKDTAYRITCIEDLVEWTNNYNNYKNSHIILENTVDFNSTASYKNAKVKISDINENGKTEELITELTTGKGFNPIESFSGVFDGQNNEIKNIFEYRTQNAGLFSTIIKANISNLTITGTITAINSYAGGIAGYQNGGSTITNTINNAKTFGIETGGIVGMSVNSINITKCCNLNNVEGTEKAGGIVGYLYGAHSTTTIEECFNKARINSSNGSAGGINGRLPAGLMGNISNCYSIAKDISSNKSASIAIKENGNSVSINNCFYYNEKDLISYGGIEKKTSDYMKTDNFLDELNTEGNDNIFVKDSFNINNGYPILNWQNK